MDIDYIGIKNEVTISMEKDPRGIPELGGGGDMNFTHFGTSQGRLVPKFRLKDPQRRASKARDPRGIHARGGLALLPRIYGQDFLMLVHES